MAKLQLIFGLIAVCSFGVWAQVSSNHACVYVDNGRTESMIVTVDGKNPVEIPPGKCQSVVCDVGERMLKVTCGEEVLFQAIKDMRKSDHWGIQRHFFLNPDQTGRYGVYTVHYGRSSFLGNQIKRLLTPDGQQADTEVDLQAEYRTLLKELKLMPAAPWFEISGVDHVLTAPPTSVAVGKHSSSADRDVLTRVNPVDYAVLTAAQSNTSPTEDDLAALATALDHVFEEAP